MVFLIGAGMDGMSMLTAGAAQVIDKAAVLIGSERILEAYESRERYFLTAPSRIADCVEENLSKGDICVLFSGDATFFSAGASVYRQLINKDIEARILPGISSLSCFCAKVGESWSDTEIVSAHGRDINLLTHIRDRKRVFALLGGTGQVTELLEKLERYEMRWVRLYVGINLGYEDECILSIPEGDSGFTEYIDVLRERRESLVVLLAVPREDGSRSEPAGKPLVFCPFEDDEILRQSSSGKVIPLTKKPVRTLCMEALRLRSDSVLYDVGAGTGSVSVCAGLMSPDIKVYAFEKQPEACEVAKRNIEAFRADNVTLIEGIAPEIFETGDLPAPTHVFIGGGGLDIGRIIGGLFSMNGSVRIVATVISMDTLRVLLDYLDEHAEIASEVMQVTASVGNAAGAHMLMKTENSIYIFSLELKNG